MFDLRKIDAKIAEVMFLEKTFFNPSKNDWFKETSNGSQVTVEQYSTDISFAWKVLESMRKDHCCLTLESDFDYAWTITATRPWRENPDHTPKTLYDGCMEAPTAICLAALEAKGLDLKDFKK